tara:strand:- start:1109 stop:1591 length:483 start_codon:yes stop_codon:yes gene_type:complete
MVLNTGGEYVVKDIGLVSKEKGVSIYRGWFNRLSGHRTANRLVVIAGTCCCLIGCTSLKKAALVSGATVGVGAIAGSVTSGIAPALLAASGAAGVTSVVADLSSSPKGQDMTDCAPDNFWSLLGSLVEMGGWLLILIVVVPMVLGWILPGPLEKKQKQNP